jgi:hypothetical protein
MRKRRKKNKHKTLIILIGVIIVLAASILYGYKNYFKSDTTNVESKKVKNNDSDSNIEEKREVDETLTEEEDKKNQENQDTSEYSFETQSSDEEVKVDANKVVSATGFSGASNYKFYLRGTTLYFRNVSSSDNEEEIIAYNVKDIYLENKEVTAELYSDGKIVKENNYITYK